MAHPVPDPFEGLVLDDAFVAGAALREPALAERRRGRQVRQVRQVRRNRPWLGLAVQTGLILSAVLVLAAWSPPGFGSRLTPPGGTAVLPATGTSGPGPSGVSGAPDISDDPDDPDASDPSGAPGSDQVPVPEPWNDPVPELDVQVGPDWLAVGPPSD